MRPREVTALYVGQTIVLALAGSALGAILGMAVMLIAPIALRGLIPEGAVHVWQPWAMARGVGLGVTVALLFAAPPLAALRRVPPLRVMRRDVEPVPPSRLASLGAGAFLFAGILATAWLQSGSLRLGSSFAIAIVIAAIVLALAALGVTKAAGRMPRRFARFSLRHGLSALARPGAGTLGAIVALGIGVLVVLGMWLVQSRLSQQLRAELPQSAPTVFLVDIQPAQLPDVVSILDREGGTGIQSVPVVTARLSESTGNRSGDPQARPEERVGVTGCSRASSV